MKSGTTTTPPNERIPISPLVTLIRGWLEVHKVKSPIEFGNNNVARYVEKPDQDEHLHILAFHTGVSSRHLRRILSGKTHTGQHRTGTYQEVDWVPFDIADKIVCGTVGPLAWHTEPLSEFYGPLSVKAYERHLEMAA